MVVGVCGFGYSGSGAVIDLLKEYDCVSLNFKEEFFFTYFPDGLIDLYYNSCVYQSRFFNYDVAAKRFLEFIKKSKKIYGWDKEKQKALNKISKEFIDEISACSYNGYWSYDLVDMSFFRKTRYFRIGRHINKLFKSEIIKPDSKIYISKNDECFICAAKKYIRQVIKLVGNDIDQEKDICVLNQPFAANNPEASFPFFDEPRAIIVRRDPRDIYLMAKRYVKDNANWIPYKNVKEFIEFYKNQYKNLDSRENVLSISFEDLIYNYADTLKSIEVFLGIKDGENGKYFKPELSVNNTKLYSKITEYKDDIKIIEKELEDFLYCFDFAPELDNTGNCFWD